MNHKRRTRDAADHAGSGSSVVIVIRAGEPAIVSSHAVIKPSQSLNSAQTRSIKVAGTIATESNIRKSDCRVHAERPLQPPDSPQDKPPPLPGTPPEPRFPTPPPASEPDCLPWKNQSARTL